MSTIKALNKNKEVLTKYSDSENPKFGSFYVMPTEDQKPDTVVYQSKDNTTIEFDMMYGDTALQNYPGAMDQTPSYHLSQAIDHVKAIPVNIKNIAQETGKAVGNLGGIAANGYFGFTSFGWFSSKVAEANALSPFLGLSLAAKQALTFTAKTIATSATIVAAGFVVSANFINPEYAKGFGNNVIEIAKDSIKLVANGLNVVSDLSMAAYYGYDKAKKGTVTKTDVAFDLPGETVTETTMASNNSVSFDLSDANEITTLGAVSFDLLDAE